MRFLHPNHRQLPPPARSVAGRAAACALLAVTVGLSALAGAAPAVAADGTTDVTVQVATDDGNLAWSAPTVVPMRATAAGTLIGPGADALAIRNLSAFPIRVKTMDAQAADPFHLVADVDNSTGNNDFQMSVNGVVAAPSVELADDGTWAMGYAGNADGTDMLPLTVSAAKIARVTEDLSQAKKAATVTWTVEPTEYVKPEPKPDANGVAFAVYSADDKSLDLYKRDRKPEVGGTFNGKTVTELFDLDESDSYSTKSWPWKNPFSDKATKATETVEVVDSGIKPYSTEQWFNSFDKLENAYVAKLDTSNLVNMGQMFAACSSLTGLDLSNWDTSSAVDADGMFQYCSKLSNLDSIANWDTSNLNTLSDLFWNCKSLTSLDLSNWNTSGVKKMVETFAGCNALTALDLSGWDTSNVDNMCYMFSNCASLATVGDLSGWDVSNVTVMRYIFSGCSSLHLDCSAWTMNDYVADGPFNDDAPGVIPPNWPWLRPTK